MTDQLEVKADELQAGHQREEEREVVITADQSVPDEEEKQPLTLMIHVSVTSSFPHNQRLLEVILMQQRLVLLKETEVALQRALTQCQVEPRTTCTARSRVLYINCTCLSDSDSLRGGGAELTSAKVGGYVLQLVYLSDSFPPGEVKDQHPVA